MHLYLAISMQYDVLSHVCFLQFLRFSQLDSQQWTRSQIFLLYIYNLVSEFSYLAIHSFPIEYISVYEYYIGEIGVLYYLRLVWFLLPGCVHSLAGCEPRDF